MREEKGEKKKKKKKKKGTRASVSSHDPDLPRGMGETRKGMRGEVMRRLKDSLTHLRTRRCWVDMLLLPAGLPSGLYA